MTRLLIALAAATALAAPAWAQADVLVNSPKTHAVCGDAIKVGVWAQPGTTGWRTVNISARDRVTGRVVMRHTVTAIPVTSHWRMWYVGAPSCHTTTITHRGVAHGRTWTYRVTVHFRNEGV